METKNKILKRSGEKGITLIALVVTIVVLLILAGVSISMVLGENGLIAKAKEAKAKIEQDALNTEIALNNLYGEMASTFGETGSSGDKDDDSVENPTPITPEIILDKTNITKEIENGSTATDVLTATLKNASGDLTWTSSNESVAEISGEGNTKTITLKEEGTATITVSYGEIASANCYITVKEVSLLEFKAIYNGELVTAKAREGMTWEEFVNDPEYNTIGLWLWNDAVMYGGDKTKFESFLEGSTSVMPSNIFWGKTASQTVLPTFKWEEIDSEYYKDGVFVLGSPTTSITFSKEELSESFEAAGGSITYWTLEP